MSAPSISGITAMVMSTHTPTRIALPIVPTPGRSRNGIHSNNTTKLVATITVPSERSRRSDTPS